MMQLIRGAPGEVEAEPDDEHDVEQDHEEVESRELEFGDAYLWESMRGLVIYSSAYESCASSQTSSSESRPVASPMLVSAAP